MSRYSTDVRASVVITWATCPRCGAPGPVTEDSRAPEELRPQCCRLVDPKAFERPHVEKYSRLNELRAERLQGAGLRPRGLRRLIARDSGGL